ncbi:hypothetical protein LTR85_009919 [Meristemomyces frigidus]|nr:hypothetical protein LTR85_009919 [Meristemomyces frigidus]
MTSLFPLTNVPNQTLETFAKFNMPGEYIFRRDDAQDLKPDDVKAMEAYAFFASYSAQMGWVDAVCPI